MKAILVGLMFCLAGMPLWGAKYIFLFIGDGMGPEQMRTAELFSQIRHNRACAWESFPVRGELKTASANAKVTDSAAAATALMCGVKTNNGRIGVDPAGNPVENIAETAAKYGIPSGAITTTKLNDATPGAMYAHVISRAKYGDVIRQLPGKGLLKFIIGDTPYFYPKEDFDRFDCLKKNRLTVISGNRNAFLTVTKQSLPLYAEFDMRFVENRDPAVTVSLPEMVTKGIELLSGDPNGFLLMVEGGKIDHCGHGSNFRLLLGEAPEFADAVAVAAEFQKQHPEETLIVVCADHETGELELTTDPNHDWKSVFALADRKNGTLPQFPGVKWGSKGHHTGRNVPVRAIGIGANLFTGTQENTSVAEHIRSVLSSAPASAAQTVKK